MRQDRQEQLRRQAAGRGKERKPAAPDAPKVKVSIYLPADVVKAAKYEVADRGSGASMSGLVEAALRRLLEERGKL